MHQRLSQMICGHILINISSRLGQVDKQTVVQIRFEAWWMSSVCTQRGTTHAWWTLECSRYWNLIGCDLCVVCSSVYKNDYYNILIAFYKVTQCGSCMQWKAQQFDQYLTSSHINITLNTSGHWFYNEKSFLFLVILNISKLHELLNQYQAYLYLIQCISPCYFKYSNEFHILSHFFDFFLLQFWTCRGVGVTYNNQVVTDAKSASYLSLLSRHHYCNLII